MALRVCAFGTLSSTREGLIDRDAMEEQPNGLRGRQPLVAASAVVAFRFISVSIRTCSISAACSKRGTVLASGR